MSVKQIIDCITNFIGTYMIILVILTLLFGGKLQFCSFKYETKGLIPYTVNKIKENLNETKK